MNGSKEEKEKEALAAGQLLRRQYSARHDLEKMLAYVGPQTEINSLLKSIWEDLYLLSIFESRLVMVDWNYSREIFSGFSQVLCDIRDRLNRLHEFPTSDQIKDYVQGSGAVCRFVGRLEKKYPGLVEQLAQEEATQGLQRAPSDLGEACQYVPPDLESGLRSLVLPSDHERPKTAKAPPTAPTVSERESPISRSCIFELRAAFGEDSWGSGESDSESSNRKKGGDSPSCDW